MDPWDAGLVDLAGDQGLLGQRAGRTGAAVIDWLSERSDAFRESVAYVTIDPAAVHASAIRTPGLLPPPRSWPTISIWSNSAPMR